MSGNNKESISDSVFFKYSLTIILDLRIFLSLVSELYSVPSTDRNPKSIENSGWLKYYSGVFDHVEIDSTRILEQSIKREVLCVLFLNVYY
jgi:hypothetical protein